MTIISLLSDFGLKDPYVPEMKAVILSICPEARIVDISHEIEKFNIRNGAFVLASAAPYFPKGTIHVAVVDPGVGTKRRTILIVTKRAFYVGPDNGLLMLSAQRQGINHVYHVTNKRFMLPQVSRTFHGRDIFAPTAAYLAKGHAPSESGPEINDYVVPKFAKPSLRKNVLFGEVLHIDDFGNVVTNVSMRELEKIGIKEGDRFHVKLKKDIITLKLCIAYGEVKAKQPLAIIGSHSFLEISVNQGNAARKFKVEIGEAVQVSFS
ncbi:MAG: S-adenosyl-l-methionine hydroxide adenosyltransferase family protein [Candidatus Bathyarchaeota archaeon]|nr:S-adenosyl-l-methionine hydroxide adenosyltransferase family protein [Candidatus Bathyarchaeota archaeon]